MRCPKSRFPIQIIVFDELELIIFVSQGLTLSTASLVYLKMSHLSLLAVVIWTKHLHFWRCELVAILSFQANQSLLAISQPGEARVPQAHVKSGNSPTAWIRSSIARRSEMS